MSRSVAMESKVRTACAPLLALLASPQGSADLSETILLPPGAVADLVARLDDSAAPPPPRPAWPDWADRSPTGWGGEEPWRRWVELLRAEARAERPDPQRRARLALLARRQGRDPDAWRHLAACGAADATGASGVDGAASPWIATILPAFLPGVPVDRLGAPLEEGVLLRPALPPATHDPRGSLRELAGRVMEHRRVEVGETVLSLRVLVEGDGVQVDLTHLSGPPVRVRVQPPVPPGVDLALLYADWERVAEGPVAIELTASREDPVRTLWGRFRSRRDRWPAPLPPPGAAPRPRSPLRVIVPAGADAPHLARFAEALSELFDVACVLAHERRADGDPPPAGPFEPTTLHLGGGPDADRKLVAMISLVEAYALAGAAR